jgi:myosin heavy subunit
MKELLEKLTKGETTVDDVLKAIDEADKDKIPRSRLNDKIEEAKELSKQLKDRDTQLEELGKKAKGNEELEKQINELKESNKTTATEYQSKLDKQAFDFALEKAITGAQAKNPRAVKALLDLEKIKMDGEKLLGFDDQLTVLKTSDGYLFGEAEKLGGRKPNDTTTPPGSQAANLQTEYEKAVSGGNMPLAISIKNRIFRGEEQGE